jgi:hypothetical protein
VIVKAAQDFIPRGGGKLVIEPMSLKRKLQYYAKDTFNPVSLLIPALPAAIIMADPPRRYPREWRDGADAFGRNFGDCLITELAANSGKFIAGAITHEDPRYYPDQARGFAHRTWHAIAFTFVDRNDQGRPVPAVSNFVGAAAAGFVGRAYLPDGYNDLVHAGQRSAGTLGGYVPTLLVGYATQNLLTEFSPELKKLGRKLHLPFVPKN